MRSAFVAAFVSTSLAFSVIGHTEMASGQARGAVQPGTIATVAGSETAGLAGDGGPALAARLNEPRAVASDAKGNLYIVDHANGRIRRVTPDGVITTVAGSGGPAEQIRESFGGDGGPASSARLWKPSDVAVDARGNIYIADSGNRRIRKVTPEGTITTVAGNGLLMTTRVNDDGGPATSAKLSYPVGVAVDAIGNIYIADSDSHRVRKVTPDGVIHTVAGTGTEGFSGDGGPATSAQLNLPERIALDSAGNLYISDARNSRIRKVSISGTISTVVQNETHGIALDAAGNLYLIGLHNILKTTGDGVKVAIAGDGTQGFSGDGGPAVSARLGKPQGIAFDAAGNLYIADTLNSRIRRVTGVGGAAKSGAITVAAPSSGNSNPPYPVGGDVTSPVLISRVSPSYTDAARQERVQGTVSVQLIVHKDGTVEVVRVVRGLGFGLDESAIAAVLQWRFRPGARNGEPVDVLITVDVGYALR